MFDYGDGKCKLCVEMEEGFHHIITECEVLKACIIDYQPTLALLHEEIVCKDEMAFGLVGDPIGEISPKAKLRNFLPLLSDMSFLKIDILILGERKLQSWF